MKLSQFDGKCVRLTDDLGNVFEGICCYNGKEYNEHEFGRAEDGVQIGFMLIYRSQIKKIESLEKHHGPYGHFSAPYGALEEIAVEDGLDMIDEVFLSEEEIHTLRLMTCIEQYLDDGRDSELPERQALSALLQKLPCFYKDEEVRRQAKRLTDKLNKQ